MLALYVLMAAYLSTLSRRVRPYVLIALLVFNLGYQAAFHFPGPYRFRYGKAAELIASMEPTQGPVAVHGQVDMPEDAMRYHLRSRGIRVKFLQIENALVDEAAGRNSDAQAPWFVLTRPADRAIVLRQLESTGTPYKEFDLTAAKYLVVVCVEPRDSS